MPNPFEQQRALAAGEAIALLDRGVVAVTGPDRLSWLDSMTSQALTGLQPGESAETLLLDPNGRIEHALRVVDDGTTTWLIVDPGEAAPLAAWLDRMRFMLRVEVADRSADFDVIGFVPSGPASIPLVEPSESEVPAPGEPRFSTGRAPGSGAVAWRDPWGAVQAGGWQYATGEHPAAGWAWTEELRPRGAALDGVAVPESAYEALRIAAWRPSWAAEVDERSIPHELDWLRSAVHLAKGCYRGQETVAKVHNLGHPPRRLVFLHLDGSDNVYPVHGDALVVAGTDEPVGTVTSTANHYELGPIALAVVKRTVDPAAGVEVLHDGARLAAAQQSIVPPDAGAAVEVPRLPRLGAARR